MATLRKAVFTLITLLTLPIAVLLVCTLFALPINLTLLHGVIERSVSGMLARPVTVAGIELLAGFHPELTLTGLRIGNPHGWQDAEDFARIARARVQFELPALLQGRLTLRGISGDDIELLPMQRADGTNNWQFQPPGERPDPTHLMPLTWPDELTLRQVTIHYRAADEAAPFAVLQLDEINAAGVADAALKLEMKGHYRQLPIQLSTRFEHSDTRFRLSRIQGQLGESGLTGEAALDLTENNLALSAQLEVATLDTGLLALGWRNNKLSGPIDRLTLTAKSHGEDLATLSSALQLALQADNARLQLTQPDETVLIDLSRSELILQPGQPLQISVDGTLDKLPLKLSGTVDIRKPAQKTGPQPSALPVQLAGSVAGNNVRADGLITRDSGQLSADLKIAADGPHLDRLAALFGATGAPALPYNLQTRLRYTKAELQLSDLSAAIGDNAWHGKLSISAIDGPAPRLTASLHTALVNLAQPSAPAPAAAITQHKEPLQQVQEAETALGLDKQKVRRVQTELTRLGFDTQGADGIIGRHTRSAIRSFQKNRRQAPTGYLSADQLTTLLDNRPPPPAPQSPARQSPAVTATLLDQPLPAGVELIDGELELSIDRLLLPGDREISAVSFSGRLQEGHLQQSSFKGTLGGQRFDGDLLLDLRAKAARVQLKLATARLAIGDLLRRLRLTDAIDLDAGRFDASFDAQGTTLRGLLTAAVIEATLADGRWTFDHGAGSSAKTTLSLTRSTLQARPGKPLTITSAARLRETPLTLALQGEPLAVMLANNSWPLHLNAKTDGAELTISGTTRLPPERSQPGAQLKLSGTSLDRLGRLFETALPPLGPYTLEGELRAEPTGYRLQDLKVRLGASDLRGRLQLSTVNKIPGVDLDLQANQLRLEDFGLDLRRPHARPGSAAHQRVPARTPSAETDKQADRLTDRARGAVDAWISSDLMRRFDVRLNLEARRVVLDKDLSAPLSLAASLQNGRFTLERGHTSLAGGTLSLKLVLQPQAGGLMSEFSAAIDRLDYGILAQLLQSETKLRGHFSLITTLRGQAADIIDSFPAHASGHLRFVVRPENLAAGSMTLWELNLLTLLLPRLDSDNSRVNCVLGNFPIADGIVKLTPGALIIDTSKIRAGGTGEVDFKTQQLDLTLIPKVKSPHVFDLATPVRISGSFADFATSIAPGGLIRTIAGLPLGLNNVWLNLFNWNSVPPADGSDICNELPLPAPVGIQPKG